MRMVLCRISNKNEVECKDTNGSCKNLSGLYIHISENLGKLNMRGISYILMRYFKNVMYFVICMKLICCKKRALGHPVNDPFGCTWVRPSELVVNILVYHRFIICKIFRFYFSSIHI